MFSRGKVDDKENIFASPMESISKIETIRLDSDSSLDTMSLVTDSSDLADPSTIHCIRPSKRRLPDTLLQPLSSVIRIEAMNKRSPSANHVMRHAKSPSKSNQPMDTIEVDETHSPVLLHSPVFSRIIPTSFSSSSTDELSDVTVLPSDSATDSECVSATDSSNVVWNDHMKAMQRTGNETGKLYSLDTLHDLSEPSVSCEKPLKKHFPDIICLSDSDDDSSKMCRHQCHHSHLKSKRKVNESSSVASKDVAKNTSKVDVIEVDALPRSSKSKSKLEMKKSKYHHHHHHHHHRHHLDDKEYSSSVPSSPKSHLSSDPTFDSNHTYGQLRKSPRCQLFPKVTPVNLSTPSIAPNECKMVIPYEAPSYPPKVVFSKSGNLPIASRKFPEASKYMSSKSGHHSKHTLSIPLNSSVLGKHHSRTSLIGDPPSVFKNVRTHKRKRSNDKETKSLVESVTPQPIPEPVEPAVTSEPDAQIRIQFSPQLSDHSRGAEQIFLRQLRLSPTSASEHVDVDVDVDVDVEINLCLPETSHNTTTHDDSVQVLPSHRLSPDPVQIVAQVQSDEMLAQALQVQFDREINPRFIPVLNSPFRIRSPVRRRREAELMMLPPSRGSSWPVSTLWGLNREDHLTVALNLLTLQLTFLDIEDTFLNREEYPDIPLTDMIPNRRIHPMFSAQPFMSGATVGSSSALPLNPHYRRRQRHHSSRHATVQRNRLPWEQYDVENEYEMLWDLAARIGQVHTNTMTERQINQLPTRQYKNPKTDAARANTCHICLNEYEHGERLRILPCTHEFHLSCIDRWIKDHPTCPICRSDCRT